MQNPMIQMQVLDALELLEPIEIDPEKDLADMKNDTDACSVLEENKISEYTDELEKDVEPTGNPVQCDVNIINLKNHQDINRDHKWIKKNKSQPNITFKYPQGIFGSSHRKLFLEVDVSEK